MTQLVFKRIWFAGRNKQGLSFTPNNDDDDDHLLPMMMMMMIIIYSQ